MASTYHLHTKISVNSCNHSLAQPLLYTSIMENEILFDESDDNYWQDEIVAWEDDLDCDARPKSFMQRLGTVDTE